jgi:hypothetical protein
MANLGLDKAVQKVSIVRSNGEVVVVHSGKKKKKKQSKELKPLERMTRRFNDANLASAKSLSSSHRKSNSKKKDGWLRDMPKNISKAADKAADEL